MAAVELKSASDLLAAGPERLIARTAEVVEAADRILGLAKTGVRARIKEVGGVDEAQHTAHGLAWLATTVEALGSRSSSSCSPPSPSTARRSPAAFP
jgi:(2S)-methylsuccinyl-CoA dehydrogenase